MHCCRRARGVTIARFTLLSLLALAIAAAGLSVVAPPEHAVAIAKAAKRMVRKAAKRVHAPAGPLARDLFAAVKTPAPMPPQAIGFYAKGCLAGAAALPADGPTWQVLRLARNRNWGHPELIALIERLAGDAKEHDAWPGLLVGDIAQPRGGPMPRGHASHQVGLDADIWLTPMPSRRLTDREREDIVPTSMVAPDGLSVDRSVFTDAQVRLLQRAASEASVERIFVNPAIKKALCDATPIDADRAWLHKIRAYWGHDSHFHMRITCPHTSIACKSQPPLPSDDGCGAELSNWLASGKKSSRTDSVTAAPARRGITLDQLPTECRAVLDSEAAATAETSSLRPQP